MSIYHIRLLLIVVLISDFFLAQINIIVQSYMFTCVMTQGNSGFTGTDHSGRWYHVYLNPSLGDSYMLVFRKLRQKLRLYFIVFYSLLSM